MEDKPARRRVVLVPVPAQGHISPMMQLAKTLHLNGFSITVAQSLKPSSITLTLQMTLLIFSLSLFQKAYQSLISRISGHYCFCLSSTKNVKQSSKTFWVSFCCSKVTRSHVSSTMSSCTLLELQPKSLSFQKLFSVPQTPQLLFIALSSRNSTQTMSWLP